MELQKIQQMIYEVRGVKVMLDKDLAELYQVTTGNLNKAVKRNIKRFPSDFMFQLTKEEWDSLRFQIGILDVGRGQYTKYLPYVFTEQGLAMLSGILNSDIAIYTNISIMRAFVAIRQNLPIVSTQKELEELKQRVTLGSGESVTFTGSAPDELCARESKERRGNDSFEKCKRLFQNVQ